MVDSAAPTPAQITGLVLAGGRGSRMGGVDKGLQLLHGQALANHALQRLRPQVGPLALSANRHLDTYAGFGVPVWPDADADFCGPLSGMLAAMDHCSTPYLATVPCDAPLFPTDLVARLAAQIGTADIAMALAPDTDGVLYRQPVFCLLHVRLRDSLAAYLQTGGRKVGQWAAQHRWMPVAFDQPGDATAFFNANTLDDLDRLQR